MNNLFYSIFSPLKPVQFDENEWCIIAITVLSVGTAGFLHIKKRRILWSETWFIVFWNLYFSALIDYFLAIKPIDLYDTVDHDSVEIFDIPIHFMTYPATLYILMYLYLVLKMRKFTFMILTTIALTLGEFVTEHYFHLFTYRGWRLIYSVPVYVLVMSSNVYFFDWIHKHYEQERKPH